MLQISNLSATKALNKGILLLIAFVLIVTSVTGLLAYRKHAASVAASAAACQRVVRPLSQDIANGINRNKADYVAVSNETKVPWELLAAIHYRESGFARSNPDNGGGRSFGIFQFTPPPENYKIGPVSDAEFRRQLTYMANRVQDDYVNRSGLPYENRKLIQDEPDAYRVKDLLFSYNGRAAVYAQQAATYGFNSSIAPYEGSPYVMNMFDCQRANMGIITRDYGTIDGQDTRYGAFTLYARLKGDAYWHSLQNSIIERTNFEQLIGSDRAVIPQEGVSLGRYTETVTAGNRIHNFYYDDTNKSLRYVVWNGSRWVDRALDGASSSLDGTTNNDVGQGITATVYNGELQLFYRDSTAGSLRHAWTSNGQWRFETLDGTPAAVNRSSANVGTHPKVITYKNQLQLFYYDITNQALRHAWWDGRSWRFEHLDGTVSSVTGSAANVGNSQTQAVTSYGDDGIQLFYYNASTQSLRHTWWDGRSWRFENLDGTANSVSGASHNVGTNPSVAVWNNGLQVYYYNSSTQSLRHAWYSAKDGWKFETLNGTEQSVLGQIDNVGSNTSIAIVNGNLAVSYYNRTEGSWNLAYFDRSWSSYALDGGPHSLSGSSASVGGQLTMAPYANNTKLQIFYRNNSGGLHHAWTR